MATAAVKSFAGRARSSMTTMNAKSGARKHRRPGATVRIATIVTIAPIARFGSGPCLRPACPGHMHRARSCAIAAVAGRSLQDVTLNTERWRRAGLVRAAAVTYRFVDEAARVLLRHCEPTGRANARPMTGSAKIPWGWIAARSEARLRLLKPLNLETTMLLDHPSDEPTAIRTHIGAIFVSLELSRSNWLVTSLSPGKG